eukprot:m.26955 g.26955  ORF g.26955 m.26955 type:complete len:234 (-) comp11732_c0_seq1:158-859(-)
MTDLTQAMLQAALDDSAQGQRTVYKHEILLEGTVCKLGAKNKSWKERYVAVFGDHVLRYYKDTPTLGVHVKDLKPQGEINLKRDVVELFTYSACNQAMDAEKTGFFTMATRWPPQATDDNGFGIRTTYRTYYMYSPNSAASHWIKGLAKLCKGSDAYIGVNQTFPGNGRKPRIQRRHSLPDSASQPPEAPKAQNKPSRTASSKTSRHARSQSETHDGSSSGVSTTVSLVASLS